MPRIEGAFLRSGRRMSDDKEPVKLKAEWPEMVAPLKYIYGQYWAQARLILAGVALVVFLSAIAGVTAPYLFSRLIDTMQAGTWGETIVWAFVGYGILFGLSQALSGMVNYMGKKSAESLNFIAGTAFFGRILRKTIAFFIDHNPAEIQQAKSRGQNAIRSETNTTQH